MSSTSASNSSNTSTIDKLRSQWSHYNSSSQSSTRFQQQKQNQKLQKQKQQRIIQKRDFHYECPHCNEPIFYNQYWFDDFQNRYIPLSTYTHRPHKCYQKEAEKIEGLMNGTYTVPLSNVQ